MRSSNNTNGYLVMLSCLFVATLVWSTFGNHALATEAAKVPLAVGSERQLFLDDYIIGKMDGVKKVLQQVRRNPNNPIVKPEHPWEGRGLEMPTVFWDDDIKLYRMYYWGIPTADIIYTCYATSPDGIHWTKPVLGLHEGPDGTKQNNIVLRFSGSQARTRYVARNPYSDDPMKKYVALYIDAAPGLTEFAAYSPDGLNWTTAKNFGDLRGCTGAAPTANPRHLLIEQGWVESSGGKYRGIWRVESQDLVTWSGGSWICRKQPDDDPNTEFYHACTHFLGTQKYCGLHLGYCCFFHTFPGEKKKHGARMAGLVDTYLMVSRDTINWHMVDRKKPFIPIGTKDAWDAAMIYPCPEVVVGDEVRIYYGAWQREHSTEMDNDSAIGLATVPLDRFVAVEPTNEKGSLVTKPFLLDGDNLSVNVDAKNGVLRVEIQDETGKPLPGYTAVESIPIRGDHLRARPRWKTNSDVSSLCGKNIRLRFELEHAKVFAFQARSGLTYEVKSGVDNQYDIALSSTAKPLHLQAAH